MQSMQLQQRRLGTALFAGAPPACMMRALLLPLIASAGVAPSDLLYVSYANVAGGSAVGGCAAGSQCSCTLFVAFAFPCAALRLTSPGCQVTCRLLLALCCTPHWRCSSQCLQDTRSDLSAPRSLPHFLTAGGVLPYHIQSAFFACPPCGLNGC